MNQYAPRCRNPKRISLGLQFVRNARRFLLQAGHFLFKESKTNDMSNPLIVHGVEYPKSFLVEIDDDGNVFLNGEEIQPITLAFIAQGICSLSEDEFTGKELTQKRRVEVDRECDIYFIKDELSGLTKVGKAKCAKSRFRGMQTANPRIILLFYYKATESEEKRLHSKFNHLREYREWFRLSEDDVQGIYLESSTSSK